MFSHPPAISLIAKLHEVEGEGTHRPKALARMFGANPVSSEGRSWYTGAQGELVVARRLDSLSAEGYTVLHSVPIGRGESDIDHVVISPLGAVHVINTKAHRRARISVYNFSLYVNGSKTDYVRNSDYEGRRVAKLLAGLWGHVPPVTPHLVFVQAASITIKTPPARVRIVADHQLLESLRGSERVRWESMTPEERSGLHALVAARDLEALDSPTTWTGREIDSFDQETLLPWFADLERRSASAGRRRMGWSLVGPLAGIAASLTAIPVLNVLLLAVLAR